MLKRILQDVTRRRYSILIYFVIGEVVLGILLYLTIRSHVPKKHTMKSNEDYNYKDKPEVSFYTYYKIKNKSPDSFVSVNLPLIAGEETFFLNGLSLTIISGAIHYFRVHPAYWRDRLKKLRAMGANTVETYIPWNLHEPEKDCYDFGKSVSGTDYPFSEWLDVVRFLEMAKEEDLFVIIRPGPYICSEWDFGGLPSYLLSIPDIQIRTNNPKYLERVDKYFGQLIPRLAPLQITNGGPIIMVQIENEYGHFAQNGGKDHLRHLKVKMQEGGLDGYFVTSDGIQMVGPAGSLIEDEVLMTANLKEAITEQLNELKEIQPFRPAMVMEFWTGWFDHWGKPHSRCNASSYINRLMEILDFPASVNLYMFHGGTNFGFMNGANQFPVNNELLYAPDTTSYDYDALLTENGDYTEKYNLTRNLLVQEEVGLDIRVHPLPPHIPTTAYEPTKILYQLDWNKIVENVWKEDMVDSDILLPMESLPLPARSGRGERGGQSYGFVLYRSTFSKLTNPEIQIMGRVRDMATVLIDGIRQTESFEKMEQIYNFGFWGAVDKKMTLHADEGTHEIDILVENLGRNNYGFTFEDFDTRKGLLTDSVKINDEVMKGPWSIMALDFQPNWIKRLIGWKPYTEKSVDKLDSPTMYKTNLHLEKGEIFDTFLVMEDWGKGVVFVNNFNIGRYFNIGSQLALYIPAPLLQPGDNTIIIFELFSHKGEITFSSKPLYKN